MESSTVEFTWNSDQLSGLQREFVVWCHREVSLGDEKGFRRVIFSEKLHFGKLEILT